MLQVNGLQIDPESGDVIRYGELLRLTRKERLLMRELAGKAGRAVPADEMLTHIWGAAYRRELQYLRIWVSRLRSKVEANPSSPTLIKTVQGVGYLLDAGAEAITAET